MVFIDEILTKCLATNGVCIDSRKLQFGECFVAIKTHQRDGHHYVTEAFEKGASLALVDQPEFVINNQCILVNNTVETLQELAILHRKNCPNLIVIVVAGSNGKTTTKELLTAVLSSNYTTFSTLGNLNNHLGVPLSILKITKDHEVAVIEIGANHLREHDRLCDIAQPTHALVTNCGKDHLGGYGSEAAVIRSNLEVYDYMLKSSGHIFVNENDNVLVNASTAASRSFYGNLTSVTKEYPYLTLSGRIQSNQLNFSSNLYGRFQKSNIEAALHIGLHFKVDPKQIQDAIGSYLPTNNRSQILKWHGNTILLDAYNANPSSMKEMIDYFDHYPIKQKLIILGAMLELGDASEHEHQIVLEQLNHMDKAKKIFIGDAFQALSKSYDGQFFSDHHQVKQHLESLALTDHLILVKGSRFYTLEQIFI